MISLKRAQDIGQDHVPHTKEYFTQEELKIIKINTRQFVFTIDASTVKDSEKT